MVSNDFFRTVLGVYSGNNITTVEGESIKALAWRPDLKVLEDVNGYFQLEPLIFVGCNTPILVIKNYIPLEEVN